MDFVCAKCDKALEKSAELLIKGCPVCGSKVFKTLASSTENSSNAMQIMVTKLKEQPEPHMDNQMVKYEIIPKLLEEGMETEKDNIASVRLRRRGVYEINIESLFRDKKADPIILSGKPGIYRVEIIPQSKKECKKL